MNTQLTAESLFQSMGINFGSLATTMAMVVGYGVSAAIVVGVVFIAIKKAFNWFGDFSAVLEVHKAEHDKDFGPMSAQDLADHEAYNEHLKMESFWEGYDEDQDPVYQAYKAKGRKAIDAEYERYSAVKDWMEGYDEDFDGGKE